LCVARLPALLALAALLLGTSISPTLAAEPNREVYYQTLLAAAKSGRQPVDWQALRFAYADRPSFDVFGRSLNDIRKRMFEALNAQDYAGALNLARQISDQDFIDIDAHLIAFICLVKTGEQDLAVKERDIGLALVRSIQTGDGRTPETAMPVITVAEEYAYLRANGLHSKGQTLIHDGGHSYDLLNTVDRSGQPHPLYFLIDRVVAAEAKALHSKG